MRSLKLSLETLESRCVPSFVLSSYAVGKNPNDIASGDFNNDGNIDLVTANATTRSLTVLLGNGDGTFAAGKHFRVPPLPTYLESGDFNGDGNLDVATAHEVNGGYRTITVRLGDGTGKLKPGASLSNLILTISSLEAGDFNGDGRDDLAVGFRTGGRVGIYFLAGNNALYAGHVYDTAGCWDIFAADFNGDGNVDLSSTGPKFGGGTSGVSILTGVGDGGFVVEPQTYLSGTNSAGLMSADFNNDGKADIAVSDYVAFSVSVLLGNGDSTFKSPIGAGSGYLSLAAADFNADGNMDLATTTTGNTVNVMDGNGNGTFASPASYDIGTNPTRIVTADFNADGLPDLASANYFNDTVSVLLNVPAPAPVDPPPKIPRKVLRVVCLAGKVMQ